MKTCTNCYYYSAPLHRGDLSCAVNPGGKAEQCSAYEYEDHAAEIRHAAIKCIKASCIYSQLRDLQKRTSIEDKSNFKKFEKTYAIYSKVANARQAAYTDFTRTFEEVKSIEHPKKLDILEMLLDLVKSV